MSGDSSPHRSLREDERALLLHLLNREEPGFEQLREQAKDAMVTSSSPWLISFSVSRDTARPADVAKPVASRAVTIADQNWADVTLWITADGFLDRIEIMWDGDSDRLPRPDELWPADRV